MDTDSGADHTNIVTPVAKSECNERLRHVACHSRVQPAYTSQVHIAISVNVHQLRRHSVRSDAPVTIPQHETGIASIAEHSQRAAVAENSVNPTIQVDVTTRGHTLRTITYMEWGCKHTVTSVQPQSASAHHHVHVPIVVEVCHAHAGT